MKALIWLIVLGVLIGGGYYVGFYKPEQEKKAKIEAEAKAKAEADKKAAEEKAQADAAKIDAEAKAKADAKKKLAEQEKAKTEKKAEPEPVKQTVDNSVQIKKNNTEIASIKKALEKFEPENCKINPSLCQKCADLQGKLRDITQAQSDKKKAIADAELNKKREATTMRSARSVKDAKGWHWKDEADSVCRSMKDLPKHRKKGVEYVYAEDDRGAKAAALIQKQVDGFNVELKNLETQYNTVKAEYKQTFEVYKKELEKKLADLLAENKKISTLK
ncbi:MAG: hypothetical protein A2017_17240 [Lentisphaerae bacterium GWF2_44_16]|nr:MAG: hypothetical protein A2017_17240 [Lentisphaerae bacterium GWF2_44_16]